MYGIKFIAGRSFYENNLLEKDHAIVSEKFLETFGFTSAENAIGEKIKIETFKEIVFEIIGVFKDYHHLSLKNELPGMIMVPNFKLFKLPNFFSIKLGENTPLKSTIKKTEQVFKQFFPNYNFEYEILRDRYFLQYKQEDKMLNIFFIFSFLAIVLACIGVVGLSSFVAFLKTREIAIRKVFGANKMTVFWVLSRDFIVVLSVSFVISIPIIYYFMNHWLQNYPLRIKVSVEHFLASLLLMTVITIVIIGVNLFKAMRKQPSDVLKG